MIFNAKALAERLQASNGVKNSYMYHRVLRALEGNPHGLGPSEVKALKRIINSESSKLCKQLDA